MSSHWIYLIGSKACAWTGVLAQPVWPQPPCSADEAFNTGAIIVGLFAMLALAAIISRIESWHNYYRD